MATKLTKEVLKQLNEAWLKTYCKDEPSYNPLDILRTDDNDEFEKKLVWLLTQPDYFAFLVKYIFNVELLPFQVVILTELWKRKFPMLIATRGAGKAVAPDMPVLTPNGWRPICNLKIGDSVYGSNGEESTVLSKTELQKSLEFYRITLRDGRSIECCEDHLWKVWDKNKNQVKNKDTVWSELNTKQMYDTYFSVRKDSKSKYPKILKEYRYAIPTNESIKTFPTRNFVVHPYIIGVLLGDGCITQKTTTITSVDIEIINKVKKLLPYGYTISDYESATYGYGIVIDKTIDPNAKIFSDLLKDIGIWGLNSHNKFIPDEYLFSDENQRLELLKGLMDTDGTSQCKNTIEYYTVSNKLSDSVLDLIRSLGISCRHSIKESWFNKERYSDCNRITLYTDKPVFSLDRKLQYIKHVKSKAGQSKYSKSFIVNIEYIGKKDGMCITVDSYDKTYIIKDYVVTHNSFLLGLYSLMRCLIFPNRKVIVAGAAFRQSRFVHEYMETIWENAPILRDLCDQNSGSTRSTDMCRMTLNGSTATSIPIGTGEKIRGYRCQDLLAEEFGCLSRKSLIQTNLGLVKIEDYLSGEAYALMNMNGEFERPDKIFVTPMVDVYEVKTLMGYTFKCSEIHQVMTYNGWKKAVDLTNKDYISLGKNDYFPSEYIEKDGIKLDEDMGWLLGLLVSEGSVGNRNHFSLINTDKKLIDEIQRRINIEWGISYREPHINKRGWNCQESWILRNQNTEFRTTLKKFGLDYEIALTKSVPSDILKSPRSVMISFLSGVYEGDGSAFYTESKGTKEFLVVLYSSSKSLLETTQQILLKFGIFSAINVRTKGYKNPNYILTTRGSMAVSLYKLLDVIKWDVKIEDSFGTRERKPSIRKNGKRYVVSTNMCNKNKYIGSFDTEEECVIAFNEFWANTPEFMKIVSVTKLPEQEVLYDFHMPSTHSFVANGFIQHNSHTQEIFETVLAGFGNVSALPSEVVKRRAAKKMAIQMEIDPALLGGDGLNHMGNQIVICGTATYDFNHFSAYWKKHKQIIHSKGSQREIDKIFPDGVEKGFDWRNYSIIRLPYDALPEGFLDDGNVARSKASVHSGIFGMEFGAYFCKDSKGFFKRSMLERCVANAANEIHMSEGQIIYDAMIKGRPDRRYVIGIDPASEIDNFCIVVIELHMDHRRIVHCWTTTRESHKERVRLGLTTEDNFYSYCARRIRDLMRIFPTERIMLDSQGGGVAVSEALHETSNLQPGELPVWPVIDETKEKDTDDFAGLHLIDMVNFAKAEWTAEANHGMRKDFEDRVLLFPKFDPIVLEIAVEQDKLNNKLYDTLEDCVMEIEEMKNELVLIEITQTATGRDKWDTPEIKLSGSKKGKMRKDRYSALLMANMGARNISLEEAAAYMSYGGFAEHASIENKREPAEFIGPAWFVENIRDVY